MKIIIAGSRTITDRSLVEECVENSGFDISCVVSGCARGVDTLAIQYAYKNGIELKRFPADWKKYGLSAGYKRNQQMAEYSDGLISIWDGQSPGTKNMIQIAKNMNLPTFVFNLAENTLDKFMK